GLGEQTDEPEQALKDVLDEATAAGDTNGALRASVALGVSAATAGRNTDAIELLASATESLSPASRPDLYETLGRCYAALGDTRRAVDLFATCLDSVKHEAPDDTPIHIRFATYLSYPLTDLRDLGRAQRVRDGALEDAEKVADSHARIRQYWSLARLSGLQGQPAAALDYVRRAIALLEVTEDTLHLARARLLRGTIMLAHGKADEAGEQFAAAERLFGPNPDPLDLASLRIDQARRAAALGRAEEGEALAREAAGALGAGHPAEQGRAWAALADALALQDKAEAGETFGKAADLLAAPGHHVALAETYRSWARYLRRAGRESEALDVLDRAAQLSSSPRAPSI